MSSRTTPADRQPPILRRTPSAPNRSPPLDATPSPARHDLPPPAAPLSTPRYSVTEKSSTDLLGQRFDSASIFRTFDAVPYSDPPPAPPSPPRQAAPTPAPLRTAPLPPSVTTTSKSPTADPAVRLSQSLAATGRRMEDIPQQRSNFAGMTIPRDRYSDEAKESKVLKKKSGLASFFNLSSPRRPAISAPENPVHVTHVGYDQETGEFTVRTSSYAASVRSPRGCD